MDLTPRLERADCEVWLAALPEGSVDLIFADPPFNIGYKYDEYKDTRVPGEYIAWCNRWLQLCYRALKPDGTLWVASGDAFASFVDVAAQTWLDLTVLDQTKPKGHFTRRGWIVWYYTFGMNLQKSFTKSHTHLLYYAKDPKRYTFNGSDPAVRHKSARQLMGDKRANPSGRLPDDTWFIMSDQIKELLQPMDDVWIQSRVNGTFNERVEGQSCQMPRPIMERIIRMTSNPGGLVVDPFLGSGVTCSVAQQLGRRSAGCDNEESSIARAKKLCGV